jgi:hypothetical protein
VAFSGGSVGKKVTIFLFDSGKEASVHCIFFLGTGGAQFADSRIFSVNFPNSLPQNERRFLYTVAV